MIWVIWEAQASSQLALAWGYEWFCYLMTLYHPIFCLSTKSLHRLQGCKVWKRNDSSAPRFPVFCNPKNALRAGSAAYMWVTAEIFPAMTRQIPNTGKVYFICVRLRPRRRRKMNYTPKTHLAQKEDSFRWKKKSFCPAVTRITAAASWIQLLNGLHAERRSFPIRLQSHWKLTKISALFFFPT